MNRLMRKLKVPITLAIGLLILLYFLPSEPNPPTKQNVLQPATEQINEITTVTFVIDGDTIEIATGERVRLIGIDTPEKGAKFYDESATKLSSLILGQQIQMEQDIDDKDEYDRLLRYIYIEDIFVNLEMVRQGYARALTFPFDVKYAEQLEAAEQEARVAKRGLWTTN